jgi:hypothetical protein
MSTLSEQIAAHPFFAADVSALTIDERITLAYQRAQLILRTYSEWLFFRTKASFEKASSVQI